MLGSHLIIALKKQFAEVHFEGMGGPLMEAQGLNSMFPMERLSVMGLIEPLKRLPELLRIRGALYRHFRDNPPDIFIGIDSPDFTLHLEQKLRKAGITTAHLVSPSVWAWRKRRIHKIKRAVDLMLCLFPFEADVYREYGVPVAFVGHPLADEIPMEPDSIRARESLGLPATGKILALLPGSRGGEVRLLAPLFLQAAQRLRQWDEELSFVMPAANDARYAELSAALEAWPDLPVKLVHGKSREVMTAADAVLLASGTATLEAMLLKRPMVVAYRMAAFSWFLISRMLTTRYVALPNLLADRLLVPELLQTEATPEAMAAQLQKQLGSAQEREALIAQYRGIHRGLALNFSARAAQAIGDLLQVKPG
ncbi:MAG: lipid-A-disaccharide synthase [Proteobacteria bacterium]|nr:lipid-A-disaccharide synthase [Pseudomonadota bacterium]